MKKSNATKQIVIIDDDINILELLKFILKEENIICFNNSELAFKYLLKNKVDIIISDIEMPKINGIKLINDLINNSININRVIFMSSNINNYIDFIVKNNFLYINKPILKNKLMEYIKL